jgi:acyl carrier protein
LLKDSYTSLQRHSARCKLTLGQRKWTTMNAIENRCIEIVAKSKGISPNNITLTSTFDELNIDSLDKINISFEVEEAFEIEIPDEALGTLKTVGDMVEGVTRLRAANPPAATATAH